MSGPAADDGRLLRLFGEAAAVTQLVGRPHRIDARRCRGPRPPTAEVQPLLWNSVERFCSEHACNRADQQICRAWPRWRELLCRHTFD